MAKRIVVAGYGAVGRALTPHLVARGDAVSIVQRHRPAGCPTGAAFVAADLENADAARRACAGADVVVCTVGVPYRSHIYTRVWPVVMRNLLDASAAVGARFVFADNLYMYGPQTQPLVEDMPLTTYTNRLKF